MAPAGNIKVFAPPSPGQQVLVAAINGNLAQAVVLGGIFSDANPAPAADEKIKMTFGGVEFEITQNGDINITAPKINFVGELNVTGKITATDDVTAGDISLKSHKHGLIKTGTDISGVAQ